MSQSGIAVSQEITPPIIYTGGSGIDITGPVISNFLNITSPVNYPYQVLITDNVVLVDTTSSRNIKLPDSPSVGQIFIIKDNVGSASGNVITITTTSEIINIDASVNFIMNSNWQSISIIFTGTKYNVI